LNNPALGGERNCDLVKHPAKEQKEKPMTLTREQHAPSPSTHNVMQ